MQKYHAIKIVSVASALEVHFVQTTNRRELNSTLVATSFVLKNKLDNLIVFQ